MYILILHVHIMGIIRRNEKMKKRRVRSTVISLRGAVGRLTGLIAGFSNDGVTVYAAQAAFYTIIAFIPFLMLLISLSKYVMPSAVTALFKTLKEIIPKRFEKLFELIYRELTESSGLSVMSLTALTALWSSSRAIGSVIRGVAFIYDADYTLGGIRGIILSLLYTVSFVALLLGVLIILVFGSFVKSIAVSRFPRLFEVISFILEFRSVLFFIVFTLFFSLIYHTACKNLPYSAGTLGKFSSQLPGALFASIGWMVFSYVYSLYMKYYPSASYVYGSLAAVMLMMLWVYFCMIILLIGAEINKLLGN